MIKVTVMYPNTPGARFNHEYYRDKHMPLVKTRMGDNCKYYTVTRDWQAEPLALYVMWKVCTSSAIRSTHFKLASVRTLRKSWTTLRTTQTSHQ